MRRISRSKLAWAGPLITLLASSVDALYTLVTRAWLGEQYLIPLDAGATQKTPMPLSMPAIAAIVAGIVATLFYWLLLRYGARPAVVFISVAVTALVLSFGAPFGIPAAALQTKLLLSGMNALTAIILTGGILLLTRESPRKEPQNGLSMGKQKRRV
jgi:hypothetical protein